MSYKFHRAVGFTADGCASRRGPFVRSHLGVAWITLGLAVVASVAVESVMATPLDPVLRLKAELAIKAGVGFLKAVQRSDGSWSSAVGPAITAMALAAMVDVSGVDVSDPSVQRALKYVLAQKRLNGGIHGGTLANYNTAICVSSLARFPEDLAARRAVADGRQFLMRLQWHEQRDMGGVVVNLRHPFFGGAGYGRHGRPDLSNTQVMLQALHDAGLEVDDPAYQRSLVFITRCQGSTANDMFADRIEPGGGFIYSTSTNGTRVGEPQSMAGTLDVGDMPATVSTLRTYGSMTYAGFKSYIYAGLDRDDLRVVDAYRWICRHYTVTKNPGMPEERNCEGYYYYLVTMARALEAWGERHVTSPDRTRHDWAGDLAARLIELQRADGSWINTSSRWMETDPNLVTSFALAALLCAVN